MKQPEEIYIIFGNYHGKNGLDDKPFVFHVYLSKKRAEESLRYLKRAEHFNGYPPEYTIETHLVTDYC